MALEDEIVAGLNEVIGKDLKNLKKAKICLKQNQERLKEIRGKVSVVQGHLFDNLKHSNL